MHEWSYKEKYTADGETFKVEITKDGLTCLLTIFLCHNNYLFKADDKKIYALSSVFDDGFKKELVIGNITVKKISTRVKEYNNVLLEDARIIFDKLKEKEEE